MKRIILALSYYKDNVAESILDEVRRQGIPALMIDTGDFPSRISLDASFVDQSWSGYFSYQGIRYVLEDIRSILYRRPTHYQVDKALPESVQAFAENECHKGFGGILRSLDCFWMSSMDALRAAGFKPRQLQLASRLGLRVPKTLVTNDSLALQRFYEECGGPGTLVYKTLHGGNIPVDEDHWDAIYTSLVTAEKMQFAEQVRYAAHQFQQHVKKELELRITVVGRRVFSAAIYSQHARASQIDFRASYKDLKYERYQLPGDIEQACLALVQEFGLQYGAIDMALTPDGQYVFFEINTAGQYQWIEVHTGLPITEAIANLLIQGYPDE